MWSKMFDFQNLIVSPPHLVPIFIKKIQDKYEINWSIFRGSSMNFKFQYAWKYDKITKTTETADFEIFYMKCI